MYVGINGIAVFFKASKDSLSGFKKIKKLREALVTCAQYEAEEGRALAITECTRRAELSSYGLFS